MGGRGRRQAEVVWMVVEVSSVFEFCDLFIYLFIYLLIWVYFSLIPPAVKNRERRPALRLPVPLSVCVKES